MIPNNSPWIKQLNRTRPATPLSEDLETDIVIVGGGIAGISTAFFTLRDTQNRVVLIEADKIAHGATGHNAGLLVAEFEKSLSALVDEFGFDLATKGQADMESGFELLEEIRHQTKLQTPIYRFTKYYGLTDLEDILTHLSDNECRLHAGLQEEPILISQGFPLLSEIPEKHRNRYNLAPPKDILKLLETNNSSYIAIASGIAGGMNSALFCEELAGYLMATYPQRFTLLESSPVKTIALGEQQCVLDVLDHHVTAKKIILCTNGFENFSIKNQTGLDIDTKFHHLINGRISYMVAYFEPQEKAPAAIGYNYVSKPTNDPTGEPYFYLSRRPHEHSQPGSHNLVCIGGPERVLPNLAIYSKQEHCPENIIEEFDEFARQHHRQQNHQESPYEFCWHGLMGYTPNGIRRIGPEPCNPILMYNLGCNGIGILPSIYGGKRISQMLNEINLEKSIFDPLDQRCK